MMKPRPSIIKGNPNAPSFIHMKLEVAATRGEISKSPLKQTLMDIEIACDSPATKWPHYRSTQFFSTHLKNIDRRQLTFFLLHNGVDAQLISTWYLKRCMLKDSMAITDVCNYLTYYHTCQMAAKYPQMLELNLRSGLKSQITCRSDLNCDRAIAMLGGTTTVVKKKSAIKTKEMLSDEWMNDPATLLFVSWNRGSPAERHTAMMAYAEKCLGPP